MNTIVHYAMNSSSCDLTSVWAGLGETNISTRKE